MTELRVAAVQAAYVLMDRQATIDRAVELTAEAAAKGAQLVVSPRARDSPWRSARSAPAWSHQGEAGLEGGAKAEAGPLAGPTDPMDHRLRRPGRHPCMTAARSCGAR